MKNRGLGRGLSALLKEQVVITSTNEMIKNIDIDMIEAGDFQPRKKFESDKIQELSNSIAKDGLLQPLIVTPGIGTRYKLVAGERRWRACKLANILEVPVIIKNYSDEEILRVALLENIQREELTVMEEAEGYLKLMKDFRYTQEDLSHKLGKSRSHIANLVRLTTLPQTIKEMVNEGELSMGHARCLVGAEHNIEIANYIIKNNLNVRQTESIVKTWSKRCVSTSTDKVGKSDQTSINEAAVNEDLNLLVDSLSKKFAVEVSIEDRPTGGKLIFSYKNMEQLDTILSRIG